MIANFWRVGGQDKGMDFVVVPVAVEVVVDAERDAHGHIRIDEVSLDHLAGWRGSLPVSPVIICVLLVAVCSGRSTIAAP